MSYQWQWNGTDLAGGTTRILTLTPLTAANAGSYKVKVSNSVGSVTSDTATLTVLDIPNTPVDISGDLVVHLKFDGDYLDSSSRGNNGTNQNATTFVDGKVGSKALHYSTDNSTKTFNYVTLGKPADLNFSSNVDFSVAFWVRLPASALPGDLPFLSSANNSANNPGFTFAPSYQAGGWQWGLNATDISGAGNSINDGSWHHLAYTFNRGSYGRTYLDGVAVSINSDASVGDLDTGHVVNIGQDPSGTYSETGEADLDDLGIWRRVLTAEEVASIYFFGSNGQSFTSTAVASPSQIKIQYANGKANLTWTAGKLQSADHANGAWSTVSGASSPYSVNTSTNSTKFFRLIN